MFIIEIVGWSGDKIVFTDFNPTFCLFCIGLEFKEFLPPLPFVLILLFVGHLMVKSLLMQNHFGSGNSRLSSKEMQANAIATNVVVGSEFIIELPELRFGLSGSVKR